MKRYKHGHATRRTPEYRAWVSMRSRCKNPNVRMYPHYGGRGIFVCDRWEDFANFLEDMGPRPAGHELDRIDPDGNYEPTNCRWVPRNAGVRRCELVTYRGTVMTLKEAAAMAGAGIKPTTARERMTRLGWSVERAVEEATRFERQNWTRRHHHPDWQKDAAEV